MKFGLMFFAASDDSLGADKYRLVLSSARFGDAAGFSSVWVAERHFTRFGGLYPNPAVLHAGLATCTSRIRLNAGSVVAPLHHPLRIAEEWSVVDNLSHGRVGVSFASGWNPEDFIFFPERYADRHDRLFETMHEVQRLWRGEAFDGTSGVGKPASVRIYPKPVQPELPMWVTAAGNPRTFERAGASGAHLLTHLLDQDEETLASKIAVYRRARAAAGFDPSTGIVSLMVHTLVGENGATVREQARKPYCNYIKANIGLFKGLEASRGRDVDLSTISGADLDEFVNFLYDRFAASRGLIGTPESCAPLVSRLESVGVDELACLLDFGPGDDLILANLPHLARLKDLFGDTAIVAGAEALAERFDRGAVIARSVGAAPGLWRGRGEALAQLSLTPPLSGFQVDPASLDACSRVLMAARSNASDDAAGEMPTGFDALDLTGPLTGTVWVHATITSPLDDESAPVSGKVEVYEESGRRLARIEGLRFALASRRAAANDIDSLLYERVWQPAAPVGDRHAGARDARGRWHIVADNAGVAAELASKIEAAGGECVPDAAADLRGIIYLCGLDATMSRDTSTAALERDVEQVMRAAFRIAGASGSTPMWIVTRGAMCVSGAKDVMQVAQAPLWGFGRALAVERPGALGALVDLDPTASAAESAELLMHVLLGPRVEDMMAFRGEAMYVPRLKRAGDAASAAPALHFNDDEAVLVTGGTGGLGLRVVEWLAAHGARHIVICGRREPGAAAEARLREVRAAGVEIEAWLVDVSDYAALAAHINRSAAVRPVFTSIFHLAGVLDDGRLGTQAWERVAEVCAPKISGAWNLHQLTRRTALRHFVMFSSVSSILPAPGQSSYAAANAFLDALAHERRAQGLHALAVNWGPWSEAGHAETDYGRQAHQHLASLGIASIAPARGLRVLETLLGRDGTQVAAASVDWAQLRRADPMAARLSLLADLIPQSEPAPPPPRHAPSAVVAALASLGADERRPYLLQYLSDLVVAALKLRTDEPLDPRRPLFDVGLDSIMALELKARLERGVGVPLSATLLFVQPTLDALCDHLLGEVAPQLPPASAPAAAAGAATEDELTRLLMKEIEASRGT